ncbi:MAG: capreomycidine synthase [Gloeotrichia echinulata DVL01]|jgi:capreomycidine synthase|nr:capreomycidine synthase [Gloeotrichia echinulata DEX184]
MKIAQAPLENWLRDYYFTNEIDISSSGVEDFSMSELRQLIGLEQEEFDRLIFHDSPSLGSLGLRKAIAQRWGNGDISRVMATNGSSEAIFLVMNALLEPGDEVVVLDPGYHSLVHIAESIGCQLKYWKLRFEQQFAPDFEELKSLITQNTRMIIVNFPHNPTGVSVSLEQQRKLINLADEVGAYLTWDAAFVELTYDTPSLPEITLLYDKAISFGTLSKAYGLPGLRVGWCLAASDVLEKCIHLRDYISLALSPLVEIVAQRVIESADCLLNIRRPQAYINLQILAGWAENNQEFVEWVKPQGGVTAFPYLRGISDIEAFCHDLLNLYGVLLVPGTCFHYPNHVRLGFGGSTSKLESGLSRLSEFLNIYQSNIQLAHS